MHWELEEGNLRGTDRRASSRKDQQGVALRIARLAVTSVEAAAGADPGMTGQAEAEATVEDHRGAPTDRPDGKMRHSA